MTPADTKEQPSQEGVTAMAVDQIGAAPPHRPSGAKRVTVEDSIEVIAELISEIQATDNLGVNIDPPSSSPLPTTQKSTQAPIRASLAKMSRSNISDCMLLPTLKKFFHCLLSTSSVSILPIRNDSSVSPLKTTHDINELMQIGARHFFRPSKPNSGSLAGDFHLLSTFTYDELVLHPKLAPWMNLQGYYMVKCVCQSSEMIRVGFLSRVRPFIWREDLANMIRSICEWESSPFQFRLYPGSLSCNKKGLMTPILMVEVARGDVSAGIDFFCSSFDGENPLSPCGIPYLFITLYQNQLSDQECQQIIEDTIHHIGQVSLVHLHDDIDALVTLRQNITTKLQNVLLSLWAPQIHQPPFFASREGIRIGVLGLCLPFSQFRARYAKPSTPVFLSPTVYCR